MKTETKCKTVTLTVEEFTKLKSSREQSGKDGINKARVEELFEMAVKAYANSPQGLKYFLQGTINGTPLRYFSEFNSIGSGHHRREVMLRLMKEGYISPKEKLEVIAVEGVKQEEITATVILDNFSTNTKNKRNQALGYDYAFQRAYIEPLRSIRKGIEKSTKSKFHMQDVDSLILYLAAELHYNQDNLDILSRGGKIHITGASLYAQRKAVADISNFVSIKPTDSISKHPKAIQALQQAFSVLHSIGMRVNLLNTAIRFNKPLQWVIVAACLRGELTEKKSKGFVSIKRLLEMFRSNDKRLRDFNALHNINPVSAETTLLTYLRGE